MIEPVAIYYEQCEPGWHVPEGRAPNAILLLVTKGTMLYCAGGRDYRLEKGDLLHVPVGVMRAAPPSTAAHEMYVAHYTYAGDGETLPLLAPGDAPRYSRLLQADYMKQRFSLLAQHWLRKPPYAKALCHAILLEMLAIVCEETDPQAQQPDKAYRLVSQLQSHIAANYRRAIPMAELARLADRTPNHISRMFRQATGQTVTAYIRQIRIAAACDLLSNSQMNVGEVSEFLGFCEQSYFNKVFKEVTGSLPSAYMKERVKLWRDGGPPQQKGFPLGNPSGG
ncbi:helix-turn-helix transcriptional regulator [Paenibacillus sp. IB182496]|uniref:Helix-turn-helix transcriptional regulator n=1 Tax=Paenibacillus sabuli TaxID=2772509 RepID=A0A927BSS2_9BACL|nr:AraC family transcriptional regulator [Paenibacillus sabuli]MBD2844839.1 helix-turn-helix transcriptional regulator [Paenibacillus sabuli]